MNRLKNLLNKIPKSFVKFAFSGASSFFLDIMLFQIFCLLLRGEENYVFISVVVARIFSAIYNHTMNFLFVFDRKRNYKQSARRYILLAILQGFASATLTEIIFNLAQCELEIFVKVPVDVFLFFVSYVVQKKFVY